MSPRSDDELDVLLSRGKLGGSQRARILDKALAASRDGFWARWHRRILWSTGGLTFATAVTVMVLVLRAPDSTSDGFHAKGSDDAPLITVACLGARLAACPSGSKLAFALEGGRDPGGFLTAYADPIKPGERIWYLTNESVEAPSRDSLRRVLNKAAVIGDGQPPGAYRIHAAFSRQPIAREALASLPSRDTLARAELDLAVLP